MEQNTIYHFHPVTGQYTGQSPLELDPVDKKPLIPANATLKPVINVSLNKVAVFDGNTWSAVADYRGYKGFDVDGMVQSITEIGIEPNPTWTVEYPFVLSEAITLKYNEIESSRNAALNNPDGIVVANSLSWQTNPLSIAELNDALTLFNAAGGVPAGITWRDADNNDHPATMALLVAIGTAWSVKKQAVWQKSWDLKTQLVTLTENKTQAEIDALTQAELDAIVVAF